jgi:hypothetical protein
MGKGMEAFCIVRAFTCHMVLGRSPHALACRPSGTVVLERNWLDVYNNWERWIESTLPHFQVDQLFTPTRLTLEEGLTRPPPLLSESDLIKVRPSITPQAPHTLSSGHAFMCLKPALLSGTTNELVNSI